MNSEDALKTVEELVAAGKVTRLSSEGRITKAIRFQTVSARPKEFAVEINDVSSRGYAKQVKIVCEAAPGGVRLPWENAAKLGRVTDQQFESSAYKIKESRLKPGAQMSVLIEDESSLRALIDWYGKTDSAGGPTANELQREAIEAAMDQFDRLGDEGFRERYPQFGDPKDYWVRSSRLRRTGPYPTKPIVALALGLHRLNGGWSSRDSAASLLHNAGFVVVGRDGAPVPVPEDKPYLIKGADRIRACAKTYYIAPAREQAERSVTITAGRLHDEIGLSRNWANVCQALAGPKFQEFANLPPPTRTGPDASTTTTFTFELERNMPENSKPIATATNLILYGPPGTGKTYSSAVEAVRLCLGAELPTSLLQSDKRDELMQRYRALVNEGRIEFVTFHQSFSYEEFVEGLRPTTDATGSEAEDQDVTPAAGPSSTGFRLQPHDGIFKRICERARLDAGAYSGAQKLDRSRSLFKIALGSRDQEDHIKDGLENGHIQLGWGGDIDWSDGRFDDFEAIRKEWHDKKDPDATGKDPNIEMTYSFRSAMQVGDYVVVSDGRDRFQAFGRVTGEYYFDNEASYLPHRRAVDWIWQDPNGADRSIFYPKGFRRQAVYKLRPGNIDWDALEGIVCGIDVSRPSAEARDYVLIIDEINRANISKVFGELITLLEPDKRLGQVNEIKLRLPYSGTSFGVPGNLHIIGTMNTADRSIALLDTALRRRFQFRELMPDPGLLSVVDGIDLQRLLSVINERIEYLFDREHQVGHAYFTGCKTSKDIEAAMRHKVIPLLAEYFYEDWAKVAAVLGDGDESDRNMFEGGFLIRRRLSPPSIQGADGEAHPRFSWSVRSSFDFSRLLA